MEAAKENKLGMYQAVKAVGDKFASVWSGNAVFAASFNLFASKLPVIEQNRDVQIAEIKGVTIDKQAKRDAMTEKALFVANRIQSFANVSNNSELVKSVDYSASDLKKARDTNVVGICNNILAKANLHATNIASYGATAALISDLQTAIAAYTAATVKPKSALHQTKNATDNLKVLFKETDDILTKRLDLDIELFKVSKPDFYNQYKSARLVVSAGRKSVNSVIGSAFVAGSDEPLKGVEFTFYGKTKDEKPLVKKTTEKGNFKILNMPEGRFKVSVKKMGFKEQSTELVVVNGESTKLRVEMWKE